MIRLWLALAFLCAACAAAQPRPAPSPPRELTPVERAQQREEQIVVARIQRLLKDHILLNHCWRSPRDDSENSPRTPAVVVRFSLDESGSLAGEPRIMSAGPRGDPRTRLAIERALQAVHKCSPYPMSTDLIARDYYDLWREIEFMFSSYE
jgi:hypothetical protein